MERSLVSVVIPCYKQAHFLRQAIDSVQSQTYANIEIIVVDDGSPDDVEAVTAEYAEARLPIQLVRQENRGLPGARNAGLAVATGEYIQFLDADDWLGPEKIARQAQILDAEPDVGLVYCDIHHVYGEKVADDWSVSGIWGELDGDIFDTLWHDNSILVAPALIRREWLDRAGGFVERDVADVREDWEMWLRLSALGCRVRYLPERLTYYRRHEAQKSRQYEALPREIATRTLIACRFPERVGAATARGFAIWERYYGTLKEWADHQHTVIGEQEQTRERLVGELAELHARAEQQQHAIDELVGERERLAGEQAEFHAWAEQQRDIAAQGQSQAGLTRNLAAASRAVVRHAASSAHAISARLGLGRARARRLLTHRGPAGDAASADE